MTSCVKFLPDYANGKKTGQQQLQKVGIRGHSQYMYDFNDERVLTKQAAFVSLGEDSNGIHMSRLVECLGIYKDEVIDKHDELLNRLADSHEVDNSYWECSWDSMHSFEGDYEVRIKCNLEGVKHKNKIQWYITVVVPYASVCPCAHEMVREHGGVPHMQRATATITGLVDDDDSLHDLIAMTVNKVSNAVDLIPISLMKRKDELEWCQRAGETNLFVEGAAREIARSIEGWYADYVVVCRHEETIHQHDVVAVYRKGETLI